MTQKKFLIYLTLIFLFFPTTLFAAIQSVAVMPFENVNKETHLDWLSIGIPETVTNSLMSVRGLVLVERIQLRKVIDEQKLQLTGLIDQKTVMQVGKLIGASILVVGAFQKHGETIRLTARFVDVTSGGILQTSQATGKMENIFDLQDKIVLDLMKNLNIELKHDEIAKVTAKPTESLEAYRHFGEGALLQVKKDYQGSVKELKKATEIDPKFYLAKKKFAEIFLSLNKGNYWTYESTGEMIDHEKKMSDREKTESHSISTHRAGGVETFNGMTVFSYITEMKTQVDVDSVNDSVVANKQIKILYEKKDDGIYMVGYKQDMEINKKKHTIIGVFEPSYLYYPYDIQVGKHWEVNSVVKNETSGSISFQDVAKQIDKRDVLNRETITVPAGTFDCYVIRSEITVEGKGYLSTTILTTWFAQGVGIIKTRSEQKDKGYKQWGEEVLKEYHIEE
jgi:TolB-like protein